MVKILFREMKSDNTVTKFGIEGEVIPSPGDTIWTEDVQDGVVNSELYKVSDVEYHYESRDGGDYIPRVEVIIVEDQPGDDKPPGDAWWPFD